MPIRSSFQLPPSLTGRTYVWKVGATVNAVRTAAPSGLGIFGDIFYLGFAPQATDLGPFGAKGSPDFSDFDETLLA
jgi:hypothetical protein